MDSDRVATMLVECGAIEFRTDPPFRFTSGAISPVYVDNRLLLGFVDERRALVEGLATAACADGGALAVDAVAGTATAGIPWAAWLADHWSVPMLYVRSGAKEWGRQKSIEGLVREGWRTVVVEDLIYSGGSARRTVGTLRDAGLHVDKCVCIATYQAPESRRLADDGVTVTALTTVDQALDAAVRLGKISLSDREVVVEWLNKIRNA
jgi:orotate phosphoribosyltransferase